MRLIKTLLVFSFLLIGGLQGCAQKGAQSTSGVNIASNLDAITKGKARLTCQVECSGSWGSARKKLKSLYENRLWEDLAIEVSKIGFESDLGYFYLGKAVAGLGNSESALIYYRLGLTKIHKCDGIINNCDGFSPPREMQAQILQIMQFANQQRQAQLQQRQAQNQSPQLVNKQPQAPNQMPQVQSQPTQAQVLPPQDKPKPVPTSTQPSISTGSAFFVSGDGLLVTNWHVVEDAKSILVITFNQERKLATIVGKDIANDLAVLKIEGVSKNYLPIIENSTAVKRGTEVVTVGFPRVSLQGSEPKVTNGIVSSLSGNFNDPRFFQISVPVQPGNSGGPLVTKDGIVIGVVSAKLRATEAMKKSGSLPENVNYAIKSNYLLELLNTHRVKAKSETRKMSSGLKMTTLTENVEKATALIYASD